MTALPEQYHLDERHTLKDSVVLILVIFLIAAGVLLRLRDVSSLPIEMHSWRQLDTAALARNYASEGYRLFYPTIDWRGNTAGYVESELSLYAYATAILYGVFGVNETVARLLTIACWVISALLLFAIGRRGLGLRPALFALAFFAVLSPFGIFMGRVIMGDTTAQMFVLLAIYAFMRWQEQSKLAWFVLGAVAIACAGLSKLPLLYVGVPVAVMVFQVEGRRAFIKPRNYIAAIGILAVVAAWYLHAYQLGKETGLAFGFLTNNELLGKTQESGNRWIISLSELIDPGVYQGLLYNFTWRVLTTPGLLLAILGVLLPRRTKFDYVLLAWLLAVLFFFVFAAPAVLVSDYYTLALVAPASLFIGKAIAFLVELFARWWHSPKLLFKFAAVALALVGLFALVYSGTEAAASVNDMFAPRESIYQMELAGKWVQAVIPKDQRIIAVGGGQPEGLYFSKRYGLWFDGEGREGELFAPDKLVEKEWKYMVVFNPIWSEINKPWLVFMQKSRKLIGGNEWFLAYDISQKHSTTPQQAFKPVPQWSKQISLLGYDLVPPRPVNSALNLILYWRKDRDVKTAYTGFVHLLDASGNPCGQDDHEPLKGIYTQDKWQKGEVFSDPFEVDLSKCPGVGELTAQVGLYIPESGERLPLNGQPNANGIYSFPIKLQQ